MVTATSLLYLIKTFNIEQILISNALSDHYSTFSKIINMNDYKYMNLNKNTLFWGMYREIDLERLSKHTGKKWIYWHNDDCNPSYENRKHKVIMTKNMNIECHFSDKSIVYDYLKQMDIKSIDMDKLEMVRKKSDDFSVNKNIKDYIITLLGYTNIKDNGDRHTNWFPWNRFKDVYETIGYECEWIGLDKLERNDEKRIFVTWNEPTSLELYQSDKYRKHDIIFQKLTSLGKGMEKENWTENPKEWCKTWTWPMYKMLENLYDKGINIYGFGCRTEYKNFPEKKRICEKLKNRIFWMSWGGTPFNWNQIKNAKPHMENLTEDITFVGSKWGKIGRGNVDAWEKYLTPLENSKHKFFQYGGIGNKLVSDNEMIKLLQKSKLCPIIHAPSWQAEKGIQDRFYSVFLSGRFGICDNMGAIEIFGEDITEICTENPKEYNKKSLYYLEHFDKQLKYIMLVQNKMKTGCNFYTQWENILNTIIYNNMKLVPFLILYDPNANPIGHYNKLKNSIKEVYNEYFFYTTDKNELMNFNFEIKYSYSIYVYTLKQISDIKELITTIKSETIGIKINYVINIWSPNLETELIEMKNSENNIHIVTDSNVEYYKHSKPYNNLSPPILSKVNKVHFKNDLNIGKYVVTWTWEDTPKDNDRWIGVNTINKVSNILKKKNIALVVIVLDLQEVTPDGTKFIKDGNTYYYNGKINDTNEFLSICKNAEYCLIYSKGNSKGNYYDFRSSGKIAEFLYHDIKLVTNLDIQNINNLNCKKLTLIKSIEDIENVNQVPLIESNINYSTWINFHFKKIMYLLNFSNIVNNKNIDILGNGPSLKNYDFSNDNIKIGMNSAYRYWEKHNTYPDIYVSLDKILTKYHAAEIHNLIMEKKFIYLC